MSAVPFLSCVICGHPGLKATETERLCLKCGSRFPVIGGVTVAVSRPRIKALAHVYFNGLRRTESDAQCRELHQRCAESGNDAWRPRLMRIAEAVQCNQILADVIHAPLERCLETQPVPAGPVATLPGLDDSVGWHLTWMLPYFYQDWLQTPDFVGLRDRLLPLIESSGPKQRTLVLGAGACGLARDLAGRMGAVDALDLSLPVLLMARRLLDGESFRVWVPHPCEADLAAVTLTGCSAGSAPVRTVAAAATRLPYPAASADCVVTQYLLDVVPDPAWIMGEIARVLRPGGSWFNFGLPFRSLGDPVLAGPRSHRELEGLFHRHGFSPRLLERQAFQFNNVSALFPWCQRIEHWPILFHAVRDDSEPVVRGAVFQAYYREGDPSLWDSRPTRLAGRETAFKTVRRFAEDGIRESMEFNVGGQAYEGLPADVMELLAWLLEQADGSRTLGELRSGMEARFAADGGDVVECLRHLHEQRLLDIRQ